ncbi:MAG: hypothetical protein AB2A00_07550 [Myxococcota bacterium]
MKTYPVNLNRDPNLPTGIHDPKWRNPAVASVVAFNAYQRTMMEHRGEFPEKPLVTSDALKDARTGTVEKRSFMTAQVHTVQGWNLHFKGGSYGEIHRRYAFGGRLPAVNFHAQNVFFGVDSDGRYFLRAVVGRMDGGWGNKAALSATFLTDKGDLGGVLWQHEMDPPQDYPFVLVGKDARLAAEFNNLREILVVFQTHHAGR